VAVLLADFRSDYGLTSISRATKFLIASGQGYKNKATATICANEDCRKPIHVNNDEDRWSEHGLGHLLNPTNPEDEDREWIAQVGPISLIAILDLQQNSSSLSGYLR
jgi:hypothetical protein